jgi:hypothetical protein
MTKDIRATDYAPGVCFPGDEDLRAEARSTSSPTTGAYHFPTEACSSDGALVFGEDSGLISLGLFFEQTEALGEEAQAAFFGDLDARRRPRG